MAYPRGAVRTACIIPAINEEATIAEVLSEVIGYVITSYSWMMAVRIEHHL
jgi:hypothetical protein